MAEVYNNYSFKVDSGLSVCARAKSEEEARARIARTWPRSKIELKGIDLPSAERSISRAPAQDLRPIHISHAKKPAKVASAPLVTRHGGDYADAINASIAES